MAARETIRIAAAGDIHVARDPDRQPFRLLELNAGVESPVG